MEKPLNTELHLVRENHSCKHTVVVSKRGPEVSKMVHIGVEHKYNNE